MPWRPSSSSRSRGDLPAGDVAAWVAAALFAVHPVHVEAVANVVGQSELLVAVGVLGATILYLRDRREGPLRARTAVAIVAALRDGVFRERARHRASRDPRAPPS